MNLLALETATSVQSVALHRSDGVVFSRDLVARTRHGAELAKRAEECLREADVAFSELHALIVSEGPGSFTSLRIGYAYAFGLELAFGVDVRAVPTSASVALCVEAPARVVVLMDARRNQAFASVWDLSDRPTCLVPTEAVADEALPAWLALHDGASDAVLAGDHPWVSAHAPLAGHTEHPHARAALRFALARWPQLARATEPAYLRGVDAALPTPGGPALPPKRPRTR